MSEQIGNDRTNTPPQDIEVIQVIGKRPDPVSFPDLDAVDVAIDAVHIALDPGDYLRGTITDWLKIGIDGDLNEEMIRKGLSHLNGDMDILNEVVDLVVEEGIRRVADVAGMGAGSLVGAFKDYEEFKSTHKELIEAMAQKGVPGYEHRVRDVNGDGKMDEIHVDATSVLKDDLATPVTYIDDGIPDWKRVGPPSKGIKKHIPDDEEVQYYADLVADKASSEVFGLKLDAEMDGKNPSKVYSEHVKTTFEEPKPQTIASTNEYSNDASVSSAPMLH